MNDKKEAKVKIPDPICPFCDADPVNFHGHMMTLPDGVRVYGTWCTNCRRLLPLAYAGMAVEVKPKIATSGHPAFMKH